MLLGCKHKLPAELEREITVVEYAIPDRDQLSQVLRGILRSAELPELEESVQDAVLDAAGGFTTIEAENAFALSLVELGRIDPTIVAREKANAFKQGGLVEVI